MNPLKRLRTLEEEESFGKLKKKKTLENFETKQKNNELFGKKIKDEINESDEILRSRLEMLRKLSELEINLDYKIGIIKECKKMIDRQNDQWKLFEKIYEKKLKKLQKLNSTISGQEEILEEKMKKNYLGLVANCKRSNELYEIVIKNLLKKIENNSNFKEKLEKKLVKDLGVEKNLNEKHLKIRNEFEMMKFELKLKENFLLPRQQRQIIHIRLMNELKIFHREKMKDRYNRLLINSQILDAYQNKQSNRIKNLHNSIFQINSEITEFEKLNENLEGKIYQLNRQSNQIDKEREEIYETFENGKKRIIEKNFESISEKKNVEMEIRKLSQSYDSICDNIDRWKLKLKEKCQLEKKEERKRLEYERQIRNLRERKQNQNVEKLERIEEFKKVETEIGNEIKKQKSMKLKKKKVEQEINKFLEENKTKMKIISEITPKIKEKEMEIFKLDMELRKKELCLSCDENEKESLEMDLINEMDHIKYSENMYKQKFGNMLKKSEEILKVEMNENKKLKEKIKLTEKKLEKLKKEEKNYSTTN
ncbi:hypothetical protein SNEBB_010800 [Seison nebaliae]|nr:hypothetical protein SNEBB_010800 [Seison nebaliae]